jgi:hypothetical protein
MLDRVDALRATGIFLLAIGVAHREAFYSVPGALLLIAGFLLLLWGASRPGRAPGMAYPVLFAVLCVVAALAPYDPAGTNAPEAALTIGAAVVFYVLGILPGARRFRLYGAAALLVAAHAHFLGRFPSPQHEDVWHILNGGVDLLARGVNPYAGVPILEDGVHKALTLTYPPGALLLLAPFRLWFGDVRWAYVVAEAAVVALWAFHLRARGGLTRGREALVLIPLVLPRSSQAFYIFSNHEWVLLALALLALVLLSHAREVIAGIALGLGVASKQYFLVYPVVFMAPVMRRRAVFTAIVVAVAVTLPFVALGPGMLAHDLVGNLSQAPDPERLTLWAILSHAGVRLPQAILSALSGISLGAGLLLAWRLRRDLPRSLVAGGLSLMVFAFCSAFAAYNYYVYGIAFVSWGLLLSGLASDRAPVPGRLANLELGG